MDEEMLRILRAARDGRLGLNSAGRYVIDGEARPARAVREQAIRSAWVSWPLHGGKCKLLIAGHHALRTAEAA